MAKGTGTYDDPIICDGIFSKTIDGVKKFFKIKTGSSVDTSQFIKKSGDVLTGSRFTRDVDDDILFFNGGTQQNGASLVLYGRDSKSDETTKGSAELRTKSDLRLQCKDDGRLLWNNKEVERIELKGNNYIRYSSGLTLMWGEVNLPAGTKKQTVNLPIPFNSTYVVSLSNLGNYLNNTGVMMGSQVVMTSLSTFDIQHTWEDVTGWRYLAVGY